MRQPRFFEKGWKKVEAGHYVLHYKGYIAVVLEVNRPIFQPEKVAS